MPGLNRSVTTAQRDLGMDTTTALPHIPDIVLQDSQAGRRGQTDLHDD